MGFSVEHFFFFFGFFNCARETFNRSRKQCGKKGSQTSVTVLFRLRGRHLATFIRRLREKKSQENDAISKKKNPTVIVGIVPNTRRPDNNTVDMVADLTTRLDTE